MPRNGSGTMSITNSFTSGTTISSDDVDANFSDIGSEITNSVAKDGQTTMTGQLKASSGTAAAPGISFGSDLDCGLYRIAGNDIGFAVGGALIFDVDTDSVNMASGMTLAAQAFTCTTFAPSGQLECADGTVAAPGISFASDLDSGFYRIGANNIGWAVNGAKVIDVGTAGAGVTGTLTATGAITGSSTITGTALSDSNGLLPFPSTTKMLFVQTSAPTGWTKITTTNDAALRVVSGAASTGGTAGFTTAFAARTIAQANLPNINLASNTQGANLDHTHTSGALVTVQSGAGADNIFQLGASVVSGSNNSTLNHTHVVPLGGSGTAMDFAVKYVDVIQASKD